MLDQTEQVATEEIVTEAPEVETPVIEPEPEIVIAIEGEEPEADPEAEIDAELGDKGRHALRAAREAAKQARAEARELKAKLAEREQQRPDDDIGPMPTYADFGYQDEAAAKAIIEWNEKKRKIDERKAAEQAEQQSREEAYQTKLKTYHAERNKVGVDDDVQAKVVAVLSAQQQAALMDASIDPAKVVAALAKTPKVLEDLSKIKEIHKFTYRLAQIEGKITVTTKAPPPPETKMKGGSPGSATNFAGQLEAAEKRADVTGDRSEINRIKRQMREAGIA